MAWLLHDLQLHFPTVRHKMAVALKDWDPLEDATAITILGPWKTVFSSEDFNSLVTKSIVPKLTYMLGTFEVNPRQQRLGKHVGYS